MYSTTPESNTSSTTDPSYNGGQPGAGGSSTGHHPQQPSTSTSSRGVKRDAEDDNDDDGGKNDASGQAEQPVKIKRTRRRKALNCEECRRLKLKCNREIPCNQCIKRGCGSSCPEGRRGKNEKVDIDSLQKRILQLEGLLKAKDENAVGAATTELGSSTSFAPSLSQPMLPVASSSSHPVTNSSQTSPMGPPAVSILEPSPPQGLTSGEDVEEERSVGTLIIGEDGRQKWVGNRAGSEWLQENGGEDGSNTPFPAAQERPGSTEGLDRPWKASKRAFPFTDVPTYTLDQLLAKLPPKSDARLLTESYYRYSDYNYSPVRRPAFDETMRLVYSSVASRTVPAVNARPPVKVNIHPHQLALFFQVLATGCQFNLELAEGDPLGDYYHGLAQSSLTLGQFLQKPTIAAVQTLHVMGHYLLSTSPGLGGDEAWPIWGLAMRACITMGLHRDGEHWDLDPVVNDERRLVFWETHVADVLQSSCHSRLNTLPSGTYDTKFPIDEDSVEAGLGPEGGFSTLKFRLADIINKMLSQVMKIDLPTSYSAVTRHWHVLFEFEKNLPYHWRCRPAWVALISISGSEEAAVQTSPEINKLDLRLTFQRHTLALNIADAVLFLQRPYFTKALYERPENPCLSKYASSFLAVFERCLVTIRINQSMSSLYPTLTLRQWFFWYHTFTAAVCMSTIAILAPRCPFASYALYELEGVIALFAAAPAGSRPRATLPALLKFLERAQERMSSQSNEDHFPAMASVFGAPATKEATSQAQGEENEDHLALLGWTTRLVKSLRGQKRRGISISHLVNPSGSSNGEPSPENRPIAAPAPADPVQNAIMNAKPISDDQLASLTQSISNYGVGSSGMGGQPLQEAAWPNFLGPDSGPNSTLGGSFPLPLDFGSVTSVSPDAKDAYDYNSLAQFNGLIQPEAPETYENVEWDSLAAQFMLGSSAVQTPLANLNNGAP